MRSVVFFLGAALLGSAIGLVNFQYRAQSLFVELEKVSRIENRLRDENQRLRSELMLVSQPAKVAEQAAKLGLKATDAATAQFIVEDGDARTGK